jgi:hypothetical protein
LERVKSAVVSCLYAANQISNVSFPGTGAHWGNVWRHPVLVKKLDLAKCAGESLPSNAKTASHVPGWRIILMHRANAARDLSERVIRPVGVSVEARPSGF